MRFIIYPIMAAAMCFYIFLLFEETAFGDENWTPEFKEFCAAYMPYVEQLPGKLHAGCCDIDHKSNDILKEGWKGESLLFCDGKEIV